MFSTFAHSTNLLRAIRQPPNLYEYVEELNLETVPERSLVFGCLPNLLQTSTILRKRSS